MKNLPKFFVEENNIKDNTVIITGNDANHIFSALRYSKGDDILVCDKNSIDYFCIITEASKDIVRAEIKNSYKNESEPNIRITLYQGIPKGSKFEMIIQKCTETGVDRIIPVYTQNTVVKPNTKEKSKNERWNKIAESAAKQCGRGKIPAVEMPLSFREAVDRSTENDSVIIPYENESSNTLKNFSKGFKGTSIGVFIGPEGGFSADEIRLAKEKGIIPVTLGKRILRTETAGLAAVILLLYELD